MDMERMGEFGTDLRLKDLYNIANIVNYLRGIFRVS